MANKSSKKTKAPEFDRPPRDPEWDRKVRGITLHTLGVLLLAGGCAVGFVYLRKYVELTLAFPGEPPKVVLKNRPTWMSDYLRDQIVRSVQPRTAHSALDQQMLVDVVDILRANPWIHQVKQVRRAYGLAPGDTLEIDCEYRAPVALVHWGDYFWLVDQDGVMLPEHFSHAELPKIMIGRDGLVNIRVIEGAAHAPPMSGRKWLGDDLTAGVELAQALYGKPFAEEITVIRVNNFNGREDPKQAQLVLITRDGTEVRWGRPITCSDAFAEVSGAEKLERMRMIVSKYHRVDASHSAIDIRFDQVTFPVSEQANNGL